MRQEAQLPNNEVPLVLRCGEKDVAIVWITHDTEGVSTLFVQDFTDNGFSKDRKVWLEVTL